MHYHPISHAVRVIILLALLSSFFTCSESGSAAIEYPVKIVMHSNEDQSHLAPLADSTDDDSERLRQRPDITLNANETVIQVQNINLDNDSHEEQVIALKDLSDPNSSIRIVIADFDNSRNSYTRSWETDTHAVNLRTFRLNLQDINGDRTLEIVASGINSANDVTLDIYQIVSLYSERLMYFPICQLSSDGTIDLIDNSTSDEYEYYTAAPSSGKSVPIVLFRINPETDEYTDTIKETYAYSYGIGRYELVSRNKITQKEVGESQLQVLFQSNSDELFADYIRGIWFRVDEQGAILPEIVSFDPIQKEIVFFSKNVEEIYHWKYSRRSLYNILTIYSENAMLQSIKPNFTISISSLSQLSVVITDNRAGEQWIHDQWGGKYIRSSELTEKLENKLQPPKMMGTPTILNGDYSNEENGILSFSYPHFIWKKNNTVKQGGYAILSMPSSEESNATVLALKSIEDNGLAIEDSVYMLEYNETATEMTITLKPATTNVYRIRESSGAPLIFTRIGTPK
ncbi:MAG: pallilysin-related adhesin [Spirochaetales bacterium]|nr:pallilysin-related adhesin [Spirochaetales bacterium]